MKISVKKIAQVLIVATLLVLNVCEAARFLDVEEDEFENGDRQLKGRSGGRSSSSRSYSGSYGGGSYGGGYYNSYYGNYEDSCTGDECVVEWIITGIIGGLFCIVFCIYACVRWCAKRRERNQPGYLEPPKTEAEMEDVINQQA